MATDAEIFDNFVWSEFESYRYSGSDRKILDFLTAGHNFVEAYQDRHFTKVGSPKPYINIVDNPEINACAYLSDGTEGIALFSGCVGILEQFFNHILAHPQTFLGLGNLSLEAAPARPYILSQLSTGLSTVQPVDEKRKRIAEQLLKTALDFLILHEVAHFRQGHNRLGFNDSGSTFIQELSAASTETFEYTLDEIITIQTLEMNADASAVAEGLHFVEKITEIAKVQYPAIDEADYLRFNFDLWLYAVCAFFRLIALNVPFRLEDIATEEHPPARVRLIWVIQTVQTLTHFGHFPMDEEEVFRRASRVASQIEQDIATITGTEVDLAGALAATDPAVDSHLEILRAKYEELRAELENVSYSTTPVM